MAKKKLDFSEYQMSDIEKRNSKLNGNSAVSYAYFINEARFNPEEREFTLFVDPANEDWYMKEDMDEYAADEKNRREIHEEIISQKSFYRCAPHAYSARAGAWRNGRFLGGACFKCCGRTCLLHNNVFYRV